MADIADEANECVQRAMDSALNNKIPENASYYQLCRYCKEPTPDGYPFCNDKCCNDFERLNKYGANNA
ncbi:hypothetical protein RHO12_03405 [Orbus sturtevantii]|uniref:hypothetical protein n=1 Tax=Orbus sturtevantii TaxID=3074109 RepID=UPI00370D3EA9